MNFAINTNLPAVAQVALPERERGASTGEPDEASSASSTEERAKPGLAGSTQRTLWVLLILIALGTRVIVAQPFLQNSYRLQLDEGYSIKEALAFGTGDLNPHRWVYPTLYPYLLAFSYGVVYVVGHLFGVYTDLSHYAAQLFLDPRVFMWSGRVISVIAGVGGVIAVRSIGAHVFGPLAGWVAAFGLALSPLHVKISAGALPDMLTMLFATLAVGALSSVAQKPSLRGYVLSGVFIGLGAGTKYWPVVLVLIGLGLHLYLWWRRPHAARPPWSWLLIAGIVTFIVFILTSPYIVVDGVLTEKMATFGRFATGTQERPPVEAKSPGLLHIVPIMVRDGWWPWLLASVAGFVLALLRPAPGRGVVAASALLLVAVFARSDIPPADYLLPAFPFLWLLVGFAVASVADIGGTASARTVRTGKMAAGLAAALVLAMPLLLSARQAVQVGQTDTRTIAERLFHEVADDGETVFVDFRSIHLENAREDALRAAADLEWFDGRPDGLPHRQRIWDEFRKYADSEYYREPDHPYVVVGQDVLGISSLPVYMIPFGAYDPPSLEAFAAAGVKYIVFSEWIMTRHIENRLPLAEFYQSVAAGAELLGKVTPEDGVVVGPENVETGPSLPGVPRSGPVILIYRVPGAAEQLDLSPLRERAAQADGREVAGTFAAT